MKQLTKMIGSLATKLVALLLTLGLFGNAWGATHNVTTVEGLRDVVANAASGDVVQITNPGTYAPGQMHIPQNITIQGTEGVKLDYSTFRTGAGISFGNVPNGATFKDLEIYVGCLNEDNIGGHGGWQWDTFSSGVLTFDNCKFSGLFGNGKINHCFKNCTFTQSVNNYFMWIYNKAPVSYIDCVFNYQKKCLHVYNEGNGGEMQFEIYIKDCKFNPASGSESDAKGPINVKNSPDDYNGNIKSVTVIIDGDTTTTTVNSSYLGNLIQLETSTGSAPNTSVAIGKDIVLDSNGKIVSGNFSTLEVGSTAEPLIAEGSVKTDNGDGTYRVGPPAVAKIGDTEYATLADAVAAAQAGQTIEMLGDTTLDATVVINKAITLDLNGKTISATCEAFHISNAFTVKDSSDPSTGSISTTGSKVALFTKSANGSIVIEGGKVESTGHYAIYNWKAGTVTINGGTVKATSANAIQNQDAGTITINGGDVESNAVALNNVGAGTVELLKGNVKSTGSYAIYNYGSNAKVLVKGGEVSVTTSQYAINNAGANASVEVSGGKVTSPSAAIINNSAASNVKVTGGEIASASSYAIYNYRAGTVNIEGGKLGSKWRRDSHKTAWQGKQGTYRFP